MTTLKPWQFLVFALASLIMRKTGLSWSKFLRIHWEQIAAADFFTVEVMTL